ncbi:MAG: GMC family oxidoreductase [Thiohalocapsa sp.]
MLIDLRSLESGTSIESDCCIIGGGAAGITLARALGRAGIDTCLLESGGLVFEPQVQRLGDVMPTGDARSDHSVSSCALRFLGGATNHWGGWCAPLSPMDLAHRPWVPGSGWPIDWEALEPWYPEAHRICQLGPYGANPGIDSGTDPMRRPPDLLTSKLGVRYWQYSPPTRFGAFYRNELGASEHVRLYLHANCIGFDSDPSATRTTAAIVRNPDGREVTVRAKHYVLACGAVENARLLLLSNSIQPGGPGNANDLVGRYFMQHPEVDTGTLFVHHWPALARVFERFKTEGFNTRAGIFLTDQAQRSNQVLAWAATLHPSGQADPDYDAVEVPGTGPTPAQRALSQAMIGMSARIDGASGAREPGEIRVRSRCEQAPNPDSRVTLGEERDALGLPRARVDWRLGELDRHSIETANRRLAEEIGRIGLGRMRFDPWLTDPDRDWPENLWGGCHHMGTTRMAASPRDGVVDADCRVHGIANLYITGSSVFPTGGCTNPTLTIVALALRLANHLVRSGSDHQSG